VAIFVVAYLAPGFAEIYAQDRPVSQTYTHEGISIVFSIDRALQQTNHKFREGNDATVRFKIRENSGQRLAGFTRRAWIDLKKPAPRRTQDNAARRCNRFCSQLQPRADLISTATSF